jgi:hypothetical protein
VTARRLVGACVVAVVAGILVSLPDLDPLVDGHGYMGDETMVVTIARNGARTGVGSYGTNPDGLPWSWAGFRAPLLWVTSGWAVDRVEPASRVEAGRLVSRLLSVVGVQLWALSLFLSLSRSVGRAPSTTAALLIGLLAASSYLSFEAFGFIASFARSDSLGFLQVSATFAAGVSLLRNYQSAGAVARLAFISALGFWGNQPAMLFSLQVACWSMFLAAILACQDSRFSRFLRHSIGGIALAGLVLALLFAVVNGRLSHAPMISSAQVAADYGAALAANLVDGTSLLRRLSKMDENPELLVVFGSSCALGVALALFYRRHEGSRLRVLRSLLEPLVLLLMSGMVAGSLAATYTVHDVYRPVVFGAYLSTVLLSLLAARDIPGTTRRRLALLMLAGVTVLNGAAFHVWASHRRFPALEIGWHGFRPFTHLDEADAGGFRSAPVHRTENQVRQTHLERLDEYLQVRDIRGLITLDPMVLILQRRALDVFYFHAIERPRNPPWGSDEQTAVVRNVMLGRGVRYIAVTRQGLHDFYHSPVEELRTCFRTHWTEQVFRCQVGRATLALHREWTTPGDDRRYSYGFEPSTPVRLYRIREISLEEHDSPRLSARVAPGA